MPILNIEDVVKEFPAIGHSDCGNVACVFDSKTRGATIEWRNKMSQPVKLRFTAEQMDELLDFLKRMEDI